MSKFVYVCYIGEEYEADTLEGVFDSEEKAKKWVEEHEKGLKYYQYADYHILEVF